MAPGPRRLVALAASAAALIAGAAIALAAAATVSRSHASAVADAVEVRHGDLSGYQQAANPMTAQERTLATREAKCIGEAPPGDAWALAQSPAFTDTLSNGFSTTVSSQTEVLPAAALVARDFAAVTGPHGIPCLKSDLAETLRSALSSSESLVSITGARQAALLPKADRSFVDRFTIVINEAQNGKSTEVQLFADAIGITVGQLEIDLTVETVLAPPAPSLERRLAELLLARAQAALR